mgnify:CR=1 FL=1
MIKYVRKRDGSKEEFSADKMQKWIELTATEGVNWSDLAFRAYRKLDDGCTSQDLHNAMVMACLDIGTEASLKVAGKFFISNLYKELFGGIKNIPTIKEFSKGLWEQMDYSDEDYEELEKVINHDKDFEYSYTTLRQMVDKYFIRSESGERGKVRETPQFMFMGIAMAAMATMPKDRRLDDVKKLYNLLSDLKINLPSPMLSNLRTGLRGYASCLTFMSDDTVESLGTGEHISYMMTAKSAGIGGYIHSRSIGDSVRKGQVKHMGKLPLYRQIDSAVHAMLQNGRGGASTIHYTCLDPEILDLANLKNPLTNSEKRIRGIDYSFMYNNVFAKAVAKNEDWLLIGITQAPDLYEAFFSSDGDKFEEAYRKHLNSGKGKKIKARELALTVLTQSLETGRIYTTNIQEANRHTPFTETIYTSNLC